jgi:hypothetical protein
MPQGYVRRRNRGQREHAILCRGRAGCTTRSRKPAEARNGNSPVETALSQKPAVGFEPTPPQTNALLSEEPRWHIKSLGRSDVELPTFRSIQSLPWAWAPQCASLAVPLESGVPGSQPERLNAMVFHGANLVAHPLPNCVRNWLGLCIFPQRRTGETQNASSHRPHRTAGHR